MTREFNARVASRGRSSGWLLNQTDAASGILRDYSCSFIFGSIIDDQQFGRRFGFRHEGRGRAFGIAVAGGKADFDAGDFSDHAVADDLSSLAEVGE